MLDPTLLPFAAKNVARALVRKPQLLRRLGVLLGERCPRARLVANALAWLGTVYNTIAKATPTPPIIGIAVNRRRAFLANSQNLQHRWLHTFRAPAYGCPSTVRSLSFSCFLSRWVGLACKGGSLRNGRVDARSQSSRKLLRSGQRRRQPMQASKAPS